MNKINKAVVHKLWPTCIYGSKGQILTVEHLIPQYWLRQINASPTAFNDYEHLFPAGKQINMMRGCQPLYEFIPPKNRGVVARSLQTMRSKYPELDPIMRYVLHYRDYINWLQEPICTDEKRRNELIRLLYFDSDANYFDGVPTRS